MHANGLDKVAVAVGVAGDELAGRWPESRPGIIGLAQHRVNRFGEFKDQGAAARLQSPVHGGEGCLLVGDITQAISDADAVKGIVRKRQGLGVHLRDTDIAGNAFVYQAVTPDAKHGGVDVSQNNVPLRAHNRRKLDGKIAGAASQVQNGMAWTRPAQLYSETLDQPVGAK